MRQSWRSMLFVLRGPVGILCLIAFALLIPEQTRDMLVELSDASTGGPVEPVLAFHFALIVLCFNLWHWSRALLASRYELPDDATPAGVKTLRPVSGGFEVDATALRYTPRVLFLGGALVGVIAAYRGRLPGQALAVVIWATALYVALHWRSEIQVTIFGRRSLARGGSPVDLEAAPNWVRLPIRNIDYLFRHAPFGWWPALMIFAVAVTLMFVGAFASFAPDLTNWPAWPQWIGGILPGPSGAMLCLGFTIAPVSVVSFWMDSSEKVWKPFGLSLPARRIPVLSLIALIILITPALVNLHAVRVASSSPIPPVKRATLGAFFADWVKVCAPKQGPVHPILVAVSGGASRAAIWGAGVLTAVDDLAQRHGTSVFAISSVSGGSLGAAGYMAMRAGDVTQRCNLAPVADARVRDAAIVEGMRADALGPMLAGTLFGDTPRALFGLGAEGVRRIYRKLSGTNLSFRGGDRAEALERAFEHNWSNVRSTIAGDSREPFALSRNFLDLAYDSSKFDAQGKPVRRAGMPVWIANGTDGLNGDRILTAPFAVNVNTFRAQNDGFVWTQEAEPQPFRWGVPEGPFPGARDALALLHVDVPISTAIDNTARFSFLSPEGELTPDTRGDTPDKQVKQDNPAQIIDGGYFENGGLQTVLELARWLKRYGPSLANNREVLPFIVQATADASLSAPESKLGTRVPIEYGIVRCGEGFQSDAAFTSSGARPLQVLAPFMGLYGVRAGHAAVALGEARAEFCGQVPSEQAFFHLYLYEKSSEEPVPLNWVISRDVASYIWNGALCAGPNRAELSALNDVLGPVTHAATPSQWEERCRPHGSPQ